MITCEGVKNMETWKAVRGCWDGSKQEDGSSGCGIVIRAVDRKSWITISKIAVPLTACTAMAVEIAEVNVLTVVRDLLSEQKINRENVNECVN